MLHGNKPSFSILNECPCPGKTYRTCKSKFTSSVISVETLRVIIINSGHKATCKHIQLYTWPSSTYYYYCYYYHCYCPEALSKPMILSNVSEAHGSNNSTARMACYWRIYIHHIYNSHLGLYT